MFGILGLFVNGMYSSTFIIFVGGKAHTCVGVADIGAWQKVAGRSGNLNDSVTCQHIDVINATCC